MHARTNGPTVDIGLWFHIHPAVHPTNGWTSNHVLEIDVGITLLMAENYRTGLVWKFFMRNEEVAAAMKAAGLRRVAD